MSGICIPFLLGNTPSSPQLTAPEVAQLLGKRPLPGGYSETAELVQSGDQQYRVFYSVDPDLQRLLLETYKKSKVKYGSFVAMDPTTGQILAMVTHGSDENFALRATFPSASVFKIVTASAALEEQKVGASSLIPMKGGFHTLYKQNVLKAGGLTPESRTRRFRLISLAEAFGKSVNSVFGKLGIFGSGPHKLREMAQKFFFNAKFPFDLALDPSQAVIPEDGFALAESASGFTRLNTMSPVHGALIASAIVNDGVAFEPYVVNQIQSVDGKLAYTPQPKEIGRIIKSDTAENLRTLMERTIIDGTGRRSFAGFRRDQVLSSLEIGGKTGTLNGDNPVGHYDWFVGYAKKGNRKIAVASLCIHGYRKGMKAAVIARRVFQNFFRTNLARAEQSVEHKTR